jgi:hypothetical protein
LTGDPIAHLPLIAKTRDGLKWHDTWRVGNDAKTQLFALLAATVLATPAIAADVTPERQS